MKILDYFLIIEKHIPKWTKNSHKICQAEGNPTYFLFRDNRGSTKKFYGKHDYKMVSYLRNTWHFITKY